MPSFSPPGSIRRHFLRIISFGRYRSHSAEDTEPLIKTYGSSRRHSAPADMDAQSTNRPIYTAHQSPQSSGSAQTTIIHEVPPGTVPFSIDAFRDQRRGYYDPEFDTPSQESEQEVTGATVHIEEPTWDPTRLCRNKSIMHCNICNRIWEYNQIHCPGCAARTLHHIPGSSEDSYTDSKDNDHEHRSLRPRRQRGNNGDEVVPMDSNWDEHGLESGTADESWRTTDAANTSAQDSTDLPAESHPTGKDPKKIRYSTAHCCYGKPGVTLVYHCCCGNPSSHKDSDPTLCTQPCTLRAWPVTAAVVFGGPAPDKPVCRCSRWTSRHVCGRLWGAQYVEIMEDELEPCGCDDERRGRRSKKKTVWWMRFLKWFCCC
ncbi:unnamed protein product [Aureobasidium uvarum]|uniref:Uncharacterized protein n=1 Tax=Aureobasidium uvarum TaxID=2773716 RepID=A0A9N8KMI3_9PEZI|nr:unnamed protein product [Aureobasidium uvarum]